MSLPRFSVAPNGSLVRTADCEDCRHPFSWFGMSRKRYCPACAKKRKALSTKASHAKQPSPVAVQVAEAPDYGRGTDWACLNRPGRCEARECRHHLGLDLGPDCAVRFANEHPGGVELQRIADVLGITRERVRQIEEQATRKLRDQ